MTPAEGEGSVPGRATSETVIPENMVTPEMDPTAKKPRSAIPMAVRHEVWTRDEGRCTWPEVDGSRCEERSHLELDHVQTMHGLGGTHGVDNLGLTCKMLRTIRGCI